MSAAKRLASLRPAAAVFVAVLAVQLALVALAGTDIPFHDQWDIEGRWLYPAWLDGSLRASALVQPFNEHRIFWTHLLNLGLFAANDGQWDPVVQCAAIAPLRAACAAGIAWALGTAFAPAGRRAMAGAVTVAFLPHLAWHTVLWGIQSHTYFALGFSLAALALLGTGAPTAGRIVGGLTSATAALLAMGPGGLVPVALLGLALVRLAERREPRRAVARSAALAALLLAAALWLRVEVPESRAWQPADAGEFLRAAGRALAWPHVGSPLAAVAMNLPLLLVVGLRAAGKRRPVAGEDFAILAGAWSAAVALGAAWMRGGGAELAVGVPSRYVDFLIPLPLANVWCAALLARDAAGPWRLRAPWLAGTWAVFLAIGWIGLSAETMRRLIVPRLQDRAAPERLAREFQLSNDPSVFAGQPRLLVPHPNPESVRAVLQDPRLRGALPPSLQPERPPGSLSRAVRALLGRQ
jgi:hypothetical protein